MVQAFSKHDDYVDMPEDEFDSIGDYIPEEVCHYTKMPTALTKILPNKQILLGNLHETNDPLETRFRFLEQNSELSNKSVAREPVGYGLFPMPIKNIKVLSTCCHNNPSWSIIDTSSGADEDKEDKYGICHSRMWAQYSELHTGVCIIFDGKALDTNIRAEVGDNDRIRHGFIKYNYKKSIKHLQGTKDNPLSVWENYRANFLCKSPEWKAEHEFRWLVRTESYLNENDSKLLVPIENAIKAIIVGKNFDEECLLLLRKLCNELNIGAWQIDWTLKTSFKSIN